VIAYRSGHREVLVTSDVQQKVSDRRPSAVGLLDPALLGYHVQYGVGQLVSNTVQVVRNPGMHIHQANVALKCDHRTACGPAQQNLTATHPWTSRRVHNHQPTLPVSASVAPRPPVHPSRAGGRGRRSTPPGTLLHPPVMLPSVDIIFHRYTRQVILALPHSGAPGRPRVRREVAHA